MQQNICHNIKTSLAMSQTFTRANHTAWRAAFRSQKPRSKLRGIKLAAQQSCGVFDPCGNRQMDMQACLLGSLLAEINEYQAGPKPYSLESAKKIFLLLKLLLKYHLL